MNSRLCIIKIIKHPLNYRPYRINFTSYSGLQLHPHSGAWFQMDPWRNASDQVPGKWLCQHHLERLFHPAMLVIILWLHCSYLGSQENTVNLGQTPTVSDCVLFSITTVCFSWSKVNELNFPIDWEVQDWLLNNKWCTNNKDVGIAKQQKIRRQKLLYTELF